MYVLFVLIAMCCLHVVLIVCCCVVCVVCTYSCYCMYVCTGKEERLWPIVRLIIIIIIIIIILFLVPLATFCSFNPYLLFKFLIILVPIHFASCGVQISIA